MHILALSYARTVFTEGSRERARMERYATHVDSLTLIVFSRTSHRTQREISSGNFFAYATNSTNRLKMLVDAYKIGKKILARRLQGEDWVITSQDPFETSVIGLLLARAFGIRHHVQIHGSFFDGNFWKRESLLNRIRFYIGLYVVKNASCIRVVSMRIKRSLIRLGVADDRITVLPIRAELEHFLSRSDRKPTNRGQSIRALYVGRLSREKNIPLIVRSIVALKKEFPNLELRIVGSGTEHAALALLIENYHAGDFIKIVPWTEDVSKEMENADVFLLASNHEGYGLVLVEAMAAGLPIVTTEVGCTVDLVRDDVHGYVVPVGDEKKYIGAVRMLLLDSAKRARFGENGKSAARQLAADSQELYEKHWRESLSCLKETV